jgi:SAM-dependent methyltransferase
MRNTTTAAATANSLEDYRWLTSPAAHEWLESAAGLERSLTVQVAQLRSHLSPPRTHLVVEQIALRGKARTKFAAAERMFFAPRLLEQATDEIVAAYKAGRFASGTRVFDLCSGIGGDLLALARRGETVGVDHDPIAAILAEANGRVLGDENPDGEPPTGRFEVQVRDVDQIDLSACAAWHIDPDRRPGGRRTTLVDLHEPGPETIERLLARNRNGAIKLSPAARMPASWIEEAELEWISRGQECRQLVAWFGDLARQPARRRATVLGAGIAAPRSIVGAAGEEPPIADQIGRYLFEPDAAVLAAKLEGALAEEHALGAIAPGIAYWTGDHAIMDPALACFEVHEVLPFHLKPLKAWLRARDIGRLEIKKRGVEHDPAELRRKLDLSGSQSATLLLMSIERRVTAILAARVVAP